MAKKIKKPAAAKNKAKVKKAPIKQATKPMAKKAKPVKKAAPKKVVKAAKTKAAKVIKKVAPKVVKKAVKAKKPIITKPIKKAAEKIPAKKVEPKPVVATKEKAQKPAPKINIKITKNSGKSSASGKVRFNVGDYAIYPSHGVGKIVGIEKTMIMGEERSIYQMHFEKERLHIKIPVASADQIGLRHPITKSQMDEVFVILRSGVKKLKGMWSRRAQEYETKINSGDIMLLAEVIRDLTRDIEDSERSYSERIIYETAIYRLTSEYVVIHGGAFETAKETIINTAKDKLGTEGKVVTKDEFDDEFDAIEKSRKGDDEDEDEDEDEEEEEDEDDDYDYDDDDDKPKKKRKK